MRRLGWELRGWLRAAGAAGVAGTLLVLAGLALFRFGIEPAEHGIEAAAARLALLQSRAREAPVQTAGPRTTGERLAAFYGFFPRIDDVPEWLDTIYAAAARASIALEKGEYVLAGERDGKLMRYQLLLPVKAGYPQVRAFIESVLQEVPAAVLESVAFQRENIGAAQVEGQLRFTIVIGGA